MSLPEFMSPIRPLRFGEAVQPAFDVFVDPVAQRRAALAVCGASIDTADAQLLLDMLGLTPERRT